MKDSKTPARSTVAGAVTNIIMNFALTPWMGPLGAAIATAVCYLETWVLRLWFSQRYIKLRIRLGRDCVTYVLIVAQSVALLLISDSLQMYSVVGGLFLVIFLLYLGDVQVIAKKGLKVLKSRL